jgi:valyl-tRNA synthetase
MKLPKVYEPNLYESDIYALWERSEAFKPTGEGEPFSIVLPPPNANGNLHVGHALTNAVQDVAIRYHRLKGDNTLYLPGADHAGFETQVVYEKELAKQGKSRFDFGRDDLYKQVYEFVDANRGVFENQLRRLGGSFDWSRYTFTLDEKIVRQAYATFKKMWDEGLIYRGERLVNFCTFHGTAFADIEVAYKEEQSKLWYLRYPLTDGSGEVVVATTRPETMFGDTGVAVHPDDARYKAFIGKTVKLPLTRREIPVIADSFVDPQFGTGAVKLTPAHDPNDFEAGQRHDLPKVSVIDEDGKMTAEVPEKYRHLTWQDARSTVVTDLAEQGILLKEEDYLHKVGHCYKCDNVIQPLLREQWFVDMQPLAREAIKALKENRIRFYPDNKRTQLITYLEGLRDWNISRQIAWGIPIPAFQNVDDPADWIYDEHVTEELITIGNKTYHRDPDVFDTWFSSGSWPYATLGYPESEDFKSFYPLSLMETGFDIMAPWVSRMIMLGLYVTGEVPFREVYLHGLVLDQHGQKMSKSKGNVVNPIDIIDQYGSDALRMGLLTGQTPGSNQPFTESKVVGARNFANKLWNIARFIEDIVGDETEDRTKSKPTSAADHWVLQHLQHTTENMALLLDQYRFSEAYELLYHFVWDDFADWYIEASKSEPNQGMLAYCLENILKLAHPFAPFVTETIWQTLAWEGDTILAKASWPTVQQFSSDEADNFTEIKKIVAETRYIKKALNVQGTTLYYTDIKFLTENAALIKRLARLTAVTEVTDGTGLYLTDTRHRCWLDIDESTARGYQTQLGEKREAQQKVIKQLEGRLSNKSYVDNAPRRIVEQTEQQLSEAREQLEAINKEFERFGR